MDGFLSLHRPCYENEVKEFYSSLKTSGQNQLSVKIEGEIKALSYADLGKIFKIPNTGSRVMKIKDISKASGYKKEEFVKKIVKKGSGDKQGVIECSNLIDSMKWLYKLIVHYIYPKSASFTYVNQVEMCIMWHISEKKPFNLCHTIFGKMQNSPKKLPYGMLLTPVFEFLEGKLNESEGHNVSKLDSGYLKMKDEEKEKGIEEEKEKKEEEEKGEEAEKKKRREEKGKVKLEDAEKKQQEEKLEEEEEKEETEKEKETIAKIEIESEKEIKEEQEKVEVKTEEKKDTKKIKKEEIVEIEDASDVETEKLELSEEEKETEAKAEKESEVLSAQMSREAMLGRMEKELIEEHNKELDEAIKQSKAIIEHNQPLIESLERMKNINERRLAT
ncbi:hypothetical protein JCGZ_02877 [Jatropha curcas]|uniref:Uncharacterized protein n=1 Tax=Jatropha curcas TaxID=180498 RepID=A0A067JFD5_JATCU|nr:hypothetical protein JCGZ_02877 [Jatropha curcas]